MTHRCSSGPPRPPLDQGIATVWAAVGTSLIMIVLLVGLHLGAAVAARHRAEAAADLAALAAAGLAVEGDRPACAKAGEIATAMGGTVTSCGLAGWHALVEVRVPIPVALPGIDTATGRAHAGPEATTLEPMHVPAVARAARPNGPTHVRPVGWLDEHQLDSCTTSGRSWQADGPKCRGDQLAGPPRAVRRLGAPAERSSWHPYR